MPSLRMEGPYCLDIATIDEKVSQSSPGNFVLGRKNEEGTFLFNYIGRANADLNSKLKSWIAKTDKPFFKFRYSVSAREAFQVECKNFHDFVKKEKKRHPRKPADSNWKCPLCKIYS